METVAHVFVNGYGAAGPGDGNYRRYLGEVVALAKEHPETRFHVHLTGGYTNRADITEANAMKRWFQTRGTPANVELHLIEETTTARDNLVAFKARVGEVKPLIFCEATRELQMSFFAKRLFRSFRVIGVPFDVVSLEPINWFRQVFLKLPLEIVAWYFRPVDRLRQYLRQRHVAKIRAREH